MSAPTFFDTANIVLAYPQSYRATRFVPKYDHISVNGAIQRDFSKLERIMQFQLGWEALLPGEFGLVQSVWEKIVTGVALTYTDVDGVTWSVQPDAATKPLTHTAFASSQQGSYTTMYTAILLFRGVGTAIPWP